MRAEPGCGPAACANPAGLPPDVAFDVLEFDGEPRTALPYRERQALLETLGLDYGPWRTTPTTEDGHVLYEIVQQRGLEGIVAKRLDEPYRPGERRRVKTKNRASWRYPLETAVIKKHAREPLHWL